VRLDATFGNSDYLAVYMLFAIAISLWQVFEIKKTKWLRYALVVLTLMEVLVLFWTATRGAMLGFVGALIFGGLLWAIESGKKGRRSALIMLLAVFVLVAGFYMARNSSFIRNDPSLTRLASISLKDSETTARFSIWHIALQGAVEKPITGWGQEGFNYVFNKYYDPKLYGQEGWFDRAHNMYLDWLIAGGVPALLLFLALMGFATVALYRSTASRPERIILLSALAAYAFQGLFVFDNLFSYLPLVIILAMIHGLSSRPIARMETAAVLTEEQLGMIGLPMVGVALVLVLWFVNVPGIRAASDLITAITPGSDVNQNLAAFKQAYADGSFADQEITEQITSFAESAIGNPNISLADKQAIFTYASKQTQTLVARIPNDARIRLQSALLFRAAGDFPDALAQTHIAEQLSPNKQGILSEEGVEQWESGNTAAAQVAFSKAYALSPTATDLAAFAAAGFIVNGNITEGKAILQQAFGTTIVDQDAVMLAYFHAKDYVDLIAVWKKRVETTHNSAAAEYGLVAAYANSGDVAAARAEIQQAIIDHPDTATQGAAMLKQLQTFKPS
jgi:tetratricopeptide (TPR) repeat protein